MFYTFLQLVELLGIHKFRCSWPPSFSIDLCGPQLCCSDSFRSTCLFYLHRRCNDDISVFLMESVQQVFIRNLLNPEYLEHLEIKPEGNTKFIHHRLDEAKNVFKEMNIAENYCLK